MNKEEFNALELEQQVEYINTQLPLVSLNRIATSIGISESTIRDRFNSKGYIRQSKDNDKHRRFIATGDTSTNNTKTTSKVNKKAREAKANDNNIKALENRVGSLEKELEQLKAIVLSNTNNTIEITDIENASNTREIIKYNTNDLVSRNYKIDRAVADEFVKFCKVQKLTNDYKVSDLATNALVEFMKTFNN